MSAQNKLQQLASGKTNPVTPAVVATAPVVSNTPAKIGHNETANIKGLILSIVQSLELIQDERDAQKEILSKLVADHGVPAKVARKVAKILHKKNKLEVEQEMADVDALYSRIS